MMKLFHSLLASLTTLLLMPLGLFGFYGLSSRYLADDYCTSAYLQSQGFFQSIQYWRETWSGRYSFFFTMNLTHIAGEWLTPLLPGLTLLAWLGALYLLAHRLLMALQVPGRRLFAVFLAALALFATLDGTPDLYQSLYWHTGLVTYVFPLLLLTLFAAFLLERIDRGRAGWGDLALSAGLAFAAGGFSETYVAFQLAALLALFAYLLIFVHSTARRPGLLLLGAGLLGGLAALALVVSAPGNQGRLGLMPEPMGGLPLALATLRYTYFFAKMALYASPLSTLAALLAPGLLALAAPAAAGSPEEASGAAEQPPARRLLPLLLLIPPVTGLLAASVIAPSLYATSDYPVGRVLVTAQFALIAGLAAWSLLLGVSIKPYLSGRAAVLVPLAVLAGTLILAGAARSAQETLAALPEAQSYARLWDRRDGEVRQALARGLDETSAISLPHISPGLAELSADPDDWVNRCFAWHYGLTRVTGR